MPGTPESMVPVGTLTTTGYGELCSQYYPATDSSTPVYGYTCPQGGYPVSSIYGELCSNGAGGYLGSATYGIVSYNNSYSCPSGGSLVSTGYGELCNYYTPATATTTPTTYSCPSGGSLFYSSTYGELASQPPPPRSPLPEPSPSRPVRHRWLGARRPPSQPPSPASRAKPPWGHG